MNKLKILTLALLLVYCKCVASDVASNSSESLSDILSLVVQRSQMLPFVFAEGETKVYAVTEGTKTLSDDKKFSVVLESGSTAGKFKLQEKHLLETPSWDPGTVATYDWDGTTYMKWLRDEPLAKATELAPKRPGTVSTSSAFLPSAALYQRAFATIVASVPLQEILKVQNLKIVSQNSTVAGRTCIEMETEVVRLWLDKRTGLMMKLEWYSSPGLQKLFQRIEVNGIDDTGAIIFPTQISVETVNPSIKDSSIIEEVAIKPASARLAKESDIKLDLPTGTLVYDVETRTPKYVGGRSLQGGGLESVEERLDVLVEKALQKN